MEATQVKQQVPGPLGPDPYDSIAKMRMSDLLANVAAAVPDHEALVIGSGRLSYAKLHDRAQRFGRALVALGVKPGDFVCLLVPNSVETIVAMFGTSMAGAVLVPLSTRFTAVEMKFVLEDTNPVVVVASDTIKDYRDFRPALHEALPGLGQSVDPRRVQVASVPNLTSVVLLGEDQGEGMLTEPTFYEGADSAELPADSRDVDDIAAMIYTSGTTSKPRGALITHRALVGHWALAGRQWAMGPDDRFWNPVPLFHIAGIGPVMWSIAHGTTYVSDTYFDAGAGLRQIEKEGATLLYPTYPAIMRDLINHADFDSTDLSQVRCYMNVAPPEDLRVTQRAIPHASQFSMYGSTEGGWVMATHVNDPMEARLTTVGRPLPGVEVRIVNPVTGDESERGVQGEIQYRGPNTFSGYHNDPEETRATIDDEGWVHTGDTGLQHPDGTFLYTGRLKEMLKVGGENVAPAEIEEVLATHPAVKLVAVVGMPDKRLTEVVAAFVELAPKAEASEEELIAFCRERMAKYKVPRVIRFVDEWPMSATKIQRGKLKERLRDEAHPTTA
jgi:fatty-acyl-CoA synthase